MLKNNINKIFYLIVGILIFYWGKQCSNSNKTELIPVKETITRYRDTIFPKDTIYSFKEKRVPYPVYIDTNHIKYIIKSIDSLELNRFFIYKDSIEDKNVKIYSNIVTQGKTLSSFKPTYKLKVPLIIKDSVVVKRDSLVFKPNKYEIHVGFIASPKIIAPMVDLSINRSTYSIGYDPINKQPVVGYKFKLIQWTPRNRK